MTDRSDFLKSMYEQMYHDIALQYTVVWQSAGTVFAAFAIFALSEKGIIPFDVAMAIIILVSTWFLTNVVECGYWYNRNLCIIANIERQFLVESDLRDIHYYFGAHRPKNKMISHLRNQMQLGWGLIAIALLYHLASRVWPGLSAPISNFEPARALPYVVALACVLRIGYLVRRRRQAYEEFIKNSPGSPINATSIEFGVGHGH